MLVSLADPGRVVGQAAAEGREEGIDDVVGGK